MTAALKARVLKLEAKHKAAAGKPKGTIGGAYGRLIVDPDKPGYLKFSEPPGGFAEYARSQQNALQAELRTILGDDAPQAKAPTNVGIVNDAAPLKPGQKQPNFVHLRDGTEIKIQRN
ncbi:hypothetical protein [Roseovarius sp. 217]|uniref:hypothetical protein n=1 Tax=Roseovarius sp. (strain 217) TaxID=314264 RepID=UPI0000685B9F|nr:hypothetical protein [Roseovarius sp. 217]EAQ26706.1 hypothetical protein ROS217_19307 [Roseovarius sp. 217]